jgi:hypothetical protein
VSEGRETERANSKIKANSFQNKNIAKKMIKLLIRNISRNNKLKDNVRIVFASRSCSSSSQLNVESC